MGQKLGWKKLGALVVFLVICLLGWATFSSKNLESGRQWHRTDYFFTATIADEIDDGASTRFPATASVTPSQVHTLTEEPHGSLSVSSPSPPNSPVDEHKKAEAQTSSEQYPVDLHSWENSEEWKKAELTSFYLYTSADLLMTEAEICSRCSTDDCKHECQKRGQQLHHWNASSKADASQARLFILPVDTLAQLKRMDGGKSSKFQNMLATFVTRLKKEYHYLTFKGSDHVFVCMTEECSAFGADLAEALSGTLGTRAIFAGVDVDGDDMKWPCPLRVISLESSQAEDAVAAVNLILAKAGHMIKNANRWVCANSDHPVNHWNGALSGDGLAGIYMFEYRFQICCIPKSGSTMTKVLLRRMMHYKNWNLTTTAFAQSPWRSGLFFHSRLTEQQHKATVQSVNFMKAAIIRHPITRLLSAYLDKIVAKHEYNRVPGLKKCMRDKSKPPTFAEFVKCLIEKHPDPEHMDQHFKVQSAFCNLRAFNPDFLGKQSNLLNEFREFGESLGFWEENGASGWGPNGTHAFGERSYQTRKYESGKHIWEHYTEDLMMQVYHYYKEDFDRFGFSIEEMLATNPARSKQTAAPSVPNSPVQTTEQSPVA